MRAHFHVAFARWRRSITAFGLDWRIAPESPWDDVDGYEEGTYLWASCADARAYAAQIVALGCGAVDIYSVRTDGLELRPDDVVPARPDGIRIAYLTRAPIAPARLSVMF